MEYLSEFIKKYNEENLEENLEGKRCKFNVEQFENLNWDKLTKSNVESMNQEGSKTTLYELLEKILPNKDDKTWAKLCETVYPMDTKRNADWVKEETAKIHYISGVWSDTEKKFDQVWFDAEEMTGEQYKNYLLVSEENSPEKQSSEENTYI